MHPVLRVISVFGQERVLSSYGVLLAIAVLVGTTISVRAAHRAGFALLDAIATAGLVTGASLLGAFVLDGLVRFLAGAPLTTVASEGGLTFYGAPIAGAIAFVAGCRTFGVAPLRMADVAIPGVPIAHALGRIGCFFAGCCYGRAGGGPFAVTYASGSVDPAEHLVARHPVQLYEAFALLVIGALLVIVPPRRIGTGERALGYVAAYALVRLVSERFRGDTSRGIWGGIVSTSDAIALGSLVVVGLVAVVSARRRGRGARAAEGG